MDRALTAQTASTSSRGQHPGVLVHRPRALAAPEPLVLSQRALGDSVRHQFPILHQRVHSDKPLIYLDSAATSQKPQQVLDVIADYYQSYNSNVHRGVYELSVKATAEYENARAIIARFINAERAQEIVFTKNATEAINLVAFSWAMNMLKPGDEILTSVAEHHSNLEIWQRIARWTGAVVKYIELTSDTEEIDMERFRELLSPRTKLVTLVHVSNTLGSVLPATEVVTAAHKVGAKVLLDCCQSVPHMGVDVQALGADWIVASGHKMCGPTGIGFLWGRYDLLAEMPPFLGGGEMIDQVDLCSTTYAEPPYRFEAGTPAICQAIGLGAACNYLTALGMANVHRYEEELGGILWEKMRSVDDLRVYGPPPSSGRAALCSFNVAGVHPNDLSSLLDVAGIAIRAGSHCTQPLHKALGSTGSARASLYLYNTESEIDTFVAELKEAISFFKA